MTNLLPPSESTPELEKLAAGGECPFVGSFGQPCGNPSEPGAPGGVCAVHAPTVRAKIAKYLADWEGSDETPVDLAWCRANAS